METHETNCIKHFDQAGLNLIQITIIIEISITVFLCVCFISIYQISTDYTVAGKCTVDGEDNKVDKTREEADMTLGLVFPKVSKAVQK